MFNTLYIQQQCSIFDYIQIVDTTESTNLDAAQLIRQHQAKYCVCLASEQTGGRGRYGKNWHSPKGNIYLSCTFPFTDLEQLDGLSLSVGAILTSILANEYNLTHIKVKWPNDVLYAHKKLAGILIDILPQHKVVIIGLGVNVNMSLDAADKISQPYIDLATILNTSPDINKLTVNIINVLYNQLQLFFKYGFNHFKSQWWQQHIFTDKRVYILDSNKVIAHGVCIGVNDSGHLLVATATKVKAIANINFSVRLDKMTCTRFGG